MESTKKAGAEQFSGYFTPTIDKEPMAQCGLHVPAENADICMNNDIFCDIGDGQDINHKRNEKSCEKNHSF